MAFIIFVSELVKKNEKGEVKYTEGSAVKGEKKRWKDFCCQEFMYVVLLLPQCPS